MIGQKAYDQACEWIVRLDSGSATAADRAKFVRWLNHRPENAVAYEEMSQLWARMDTLGVRSDSDEAIYPPLPADRVPGSRSTAFRNVVLGSLASIALIVAVVLVLDPRPGGHGTMEFVTALDQSHLVVAPDGSRIDMKARTAITLAFNAHERRVRLARGSARFQVVHDPAMPFVVEAGSSLVKAVGTEFSVSLSPGGLTVEVHGGSVAFVPASTVPFASPEARPSEILLAAGHSLVYHPESGAIELDPRR